MRIGVNTRLLIGDKLDGIGIFTRETLSRMVKNHPDHEFVFFFDRPWSDEFIFNSNVKPVKFGPIVREPLTCLMWQEFGLPRAARREKIDLLFSPEPSNSFRSPVPVVGTFHDLNYEHDPSVVPWYWRLYYRTFSRRYAAHACRLATVSRYSRDDIVRTYGIASESICVVYNGGPDHVSHTDEETKRIVRSTYAGGNPYFYFVGTIQKRKNIATMIRAFDQFRSESGITVDLVVAGRRKWWTRDMETALQAARHKSSIHFIGRASDMELQDVAASSLGLVYVPTFEGFGLPILEAFAAGAPVISSTTSSIPEVADRAALLVPPHDQNAIADAMHRLTTDQALRSDLIRRGRERLQQFSWDRTEELLWNCLLDASRKEVQR